MLVTEVCIGEVDKQVSEALEQIEGKIIDRIENDDDEPAFIYCYDNRISPENQNDLIRAMYHAVKTGDYKVHLESVTNEILKSLLDIPNGGMND